MYPPTVDFANACAATFKVAESMEFTYDEAKWTWIPDPGHVATYKHHKFNIKLVDHDPMAVDAEDAPDQ
jgi:hypothetical protein